MTSDDDTALQILESASDLIAESGRLPVGPAVVAAACISIVLALLPAEHEAQMDGYLLATKAAQLFPS